MLLPVIGYIAFWCVLMTAITKNNTIVVENEIIKPIEKYFVTGYCLNQDPMASGKLVYDGAVACPRRIPLGTKVKIQGTEYVCEDRLAKRYDDRFDIWFTTCEQAINWGIQELEVTFEE
jgi:3D (Asp-Asp-Asp) domain-containing protein